MTPIEIAIILIVMSVLGSAAFLSLWFLTILRPDDGAVLPEKKILEIDNQEIATFQASTTGPRMILIHGLGASSYSWRYVIKELKGEYAITAVDLVGFGQSSKPLDSDYGLETQSAWLHQTIQQLAPSEPAILVGSSLGGLLSLWLSKQYPALYPKVVVLAPATLGKRGKPISKHVMKFEKGLRLLINRWTMPWIVYGVVGSMKSLNRRSLKEYLVPGGLVPFYKSYHSLLDPRIHDTIKGLPTAALVLWGKHDLQVSRHVMNDLKQIIPQAQWRELRSSHHPHEDVPHTVAEEIRAWLKTPQGLT